jgi:hypothetical protein
MAFIQHNPQQQHNTASHDDNHIVQRLANGVCVCEARGLMMSRASANFLIFLFWGEFWPQALLFGPVGDHDSMNPL